MSYTEIDAKDYDRLEVALAEAEQEKAQSVSAERARCAKKARAIAAQHRQASTSAWAAEEWGVSGRHYQAELACEEIAQAIERGEE